MVTHLHYCCTRGMVSSVDFVIRQMGMVCSPSSWAGAAQWLLFRGPRPLPLPVVFAPSQPPEEVRGWPGKVGVVASSAAGASAPSKQQASSCVQ